MQGINTNSPPLAHLNGCELHSIACLFNAKHGDKCKWRVLVYLKGLDPSKHT